MTTASTISPLIGSQPIGNFFDPDTTQRHPLGAVVDAVDPHWGQVRMIYLVAGATLGVGACVVWDTSYSATAVPNSANLGQPVGFSIASVASGDYGWFQIGGKCVALSGASVAANAAIGITAAGSLGAVANGKQILGAKVQAAATTTVAKTNTVTQSGSTILKVKNTEGWFVGLPLSGTGIAASTTISAIDPDNRTVTMNNAATATGSVTVTGTYNDGSSNYWNVVYVNSSFAQGQVT